MKTLTSYRKSVRALLLLCCLVPLFLLSSCIQPTIFTVQFPQKGKTYIGNEILDFVIGYSKTVPSADVYLNGIPIKDEFVYGSNTATASIVNIKKYLKQGVNTLTVDPLAFGPTVQFVVDNAGPTIVVTKGLTSAGTTLLELEGEVRDVSGISSLKMDMYKVTAINEKTGIVTRQQQGSTVILTVDAAGKFKKTGIAITPDVKIYSFSALDIHGQKTDKEFLADSNEANAMSISNAMRMAIGDTFVSSLRPVIASALYSTLQKAPIDIRSACWNDPNKDEAASQNPNGGFCSTGQDGSTLNKGLNPIYTSILGLPTTINILRINMMKSGDINSSGNPSRGSTVLLNKFQVLANNYLDLDMVITEMFVSLSLSLKILFINLSINPMSMTIGTIIVDTGAYASAVNKKVHIELADSNFGLQDISVSQASLGGIDLGGLIDIIMPLLEGIIGGMLPGILNPILNDELQKIVIGACMYPKANMGNTNLACNDPASTAKFNWSVNVETLKTDNLFGAGSPYDMIVGLETKFNLLKADTNARPSLGPVYVEDPVDIGLIYNSLGETGTNLTVAISSNAINQGFAALYGSGFSHFTFYDGAMHYGADPLLPVGTDGQTRIRLYPNAQPVFTLKPLAGGIGGAAAGSIGYESATLYLDTNKNGTWINQLTLGVDFSLNAKIAQVENKVRLAVDGGLVLNLNTMINNTGFPVTQSMVQGAVDIVTMYFIPELADQFVVVDLSQLANNSFNGKQVLYQTNTDTLTQTLTVTGGVPGCPIATSTNGANGANDYVCETINFVVTTNTLTSTGIKGTNLLFQMEARDPDIPAAVAIPRFDLDDDNILDYQDNCAAPVLMQIAAIKLEGGLTVGTQGGSGNIDAEGNPINGFEDKVRVHVNRWVAAEHGVNSTTVGSYIANPPVAGTGTPAAPGGTDIAWWNTMRKGDAAVTSLGTYPWIPMIYSNSNQMNSDGDRSGELCENDGDRDNVYIGNGIPEDVCPEVFDPTNDPGACTIDYAQTFVMFKHMRSGKCMSHGKYNGVDETAGVKDFGAGAGGKTLTFQTCDVNDDKQHFYVSVSPSDATNTLPSSCGADCKERVIYIYTNEYKQTEPGFYDAVNMHYLALTKANTPPVQGSCPNVSGHWAYGDVIATTMCGYDGSWREWSLTLARPDIANQSTVAYPYLIEGYRPRVVDGERGCIFEKNAGAVDLDLNSETAGGSCFPSSTTDREKAQFQVLLGTQQAKWSGRFVAD